MGWVLRIALRLVPWSWRDTVRTDLAEEARAGRRGPMWHLWQAVRTGVRLRLLMVSGALLADVRDAFRSLRHAKWVALGAIVTLGLGIGVNLAVFSIVDRMLFRPFPFREPERLVLLSPFSPARHMRYYAFPRDVAIAVRAAGGPLEDVAFVDMADPFQWASGWRTDTLRLAGASFNALEVLGVQPAAGRGFSRADLAAGASLALVRYEVWRDRLGFSRDVFGQHMTYGRSRTQIVGVLPEGFVFPAFNWATRPDGLALSLDPLASATPQEIVPAVFGRLQSGAPLSAMPVAGRGLQLVVRGQEGAQLDAPAMKAALLRSTPATGLSLAPVSASLDPWLQEPRLYAVVFGSFAVIALGLAVAGLYAVASFDVARRRREMGIRLALGATSRQITGRILGRALWSASIGLLAGGAAAFWAVRFLQGSLHGVDAREPWTFVGAALVLLGTTAVAVWLPARQAGRTDPAAVLKQSL
jgi:putative ABC transport system permease protein